ncbi:MAG: hypothetical protein MZW92_48170 [Comamonadaceae bacterium]|nr:hypothetical protein [Comamonadaceae bacterium]
MMFICLHAGADADHGGQHAAGDERRSAADGAAGAAGAAARRSPARTWLAIARGDGRHGLDVRARRRRRRVRRHASSLGMLVAFAVPLASAINLVTLQKTRGPASTWCRRCSSAA